MKINKKIITKIADKTEDHEDLKEFLSSILMEEKKGIGHWKKVYSAKLERILKS